MLFTQPRIVIVEDEAAFADTLRIALGRARGLRVVGQAATPDEARRICLQEKPHAVLVDWKLGAATDGIDLIRELAPRLPRTHWLLASSFGYAEMVRRADEAGAKGVIDKAQTSFSQIARALRIVASGKEYYCPLSDYYRHKGAKVDSPFTELEQQILERLAWHESRSEIARALSVAPSTITRHLELIGSKLDLKDAPAMGLIISTARDRGALPRLPTDC